uniref:Excinuclease ABC subunit C n=1 Tax=Acidobacterium capsulatum TaxID=33075 RepID=A0A7V4XUL3_9BACT
MLTHSLAFDVKNPPWSEIPAEAGVFALFGVDERAEPYLNRTPDLRRRLKRLLDPKPEQSKRLQLAAQIRRIEYTRTGSEFEALLCLYQASVEAMGERARERMHLRAPIFLRMSMQNEFPRVYPATRLTLKAGDDLFGPFPSRWMAERWLEQMLNLFLLRRCQEDLQPDPAFAGCIYSEMKKCLAPCFEGCTQARYDEEAAAVHDFLATRGESLRARLVAEREAASEALDFEKAAEVHARVERVDEVMSALPEAVLPLTQLHGVIVQPAVEAETVALFLLEGGQMAGPALFSTLGMRHPNEQSGSSSLFAHPTMVEAVPLRAEGEPVMAASRDELDRRLEEALTALRGRLKKPSSAMLADHLALFKRWFYRPQTKRVGEMVFASPEGEIAGKAVLRAVSRVVRAGM